MPKAPPRPRPPQYRRHVFAHLLALDCACPGCGVVYAGPRKAVREEGRARRRYSRNGYDPTSGRFTCTYCHGVWVLGVIFWPTHPGIRPGRPVDTVPTLEEALTLREQASRQALQRKREAKAPVNVVEDTPPDTRDILSTFAAKDPLIE